MSDSSTSQNKQIPATKGNNIIAIFLILFSGIVGLYLYIYSSEFTANRISYIELYEFLLFTLLSGGFLLSFNYCETNSTATKNLLKLLFLASSWCAAISLINIHNETVKIIENLVQQNNGDDYFFIYVLVKSIALLLSAIAALKSLFIVFLNKHFNDENTENKN